MKRRSFLTLLGGAAVAWPLAARAQQVERKRRIAVLMPYAEDDPDVLARLAAFWAGLRQAGWSEGDNLQVDYRWGLPDPALVEKHARELLALGPELFVTASNGSATLLSRLTSTIPIVFASASDPFETGLVANMAHPGGNVTGFSQLEAPVAGKYLDLLRDVAPQLSRVLILSGSSLAGRATASIPFVRVLAAAAPRLGVDMVPVTMIDPAELDHLFEEFSSGNGVGGLIVLSSAVTISHRMKIFALAGRHRLPAIYPYRNFAAEGGLMSFGPDLIDQYRRAASYVDRILRGEKPGDLPVQAPTRYELIVNLKTAKAIGLSVPEAFLLRADEVIE